MINDPQSLTGVFAHLLVYVQELRRMETQLEPGFADVRNRVKSMLIESAAGAREASIDPRDFDNARFAVCAWIDETILSTNWRMKSEWRRSLLQAELYSITNAGEEFFERMDRLGPNQVKVREIYFLCLCLGFVGRYCNSGDELLLDQLKKATQRQLVGQTSSATDFRAKVLFETAYSGVGSVKGQSKQNYRRWTPLRWIALTAPLLALVGLYIVYYTVLSGIGRNIVAKLGEG